MLLKQIKHQGQTYIVAKPDETFQVRVRRYGARAPTTAAGESWLCSVSIDGKGIGYRKVLKPAPNAGPQCYEGLVDGFIPAPGVRKPFKFVTVSLEEERLMQRLADGPDSANKVGTISVETYLAYECGRHRNGPNLYQSSVPSAGTKLAKSKGKKALFSPSLSTAAGEGKSDPRAVLSDKMSADAPETRKGPLVINYQTENILLLRKILDPTLPEHLALTSYAQQEDVEEDEVPDVQIVLTGPPTSLRAKRPATILVDLTGKYTRTSTIPHEVIDLTEL